MLLSETTRGCEQVSVSLFRCENCGQIYKVKVVDNELITDFGDIMKIYNGEVMCLKCYTPAKLDIIECEDWVAKMLFIVKG